MRQADDPYRIHLWNTLSWLLLGLAPVAIAGQDDPGAMRYWSSALPAVLALAYAVAWRRPAQRVRFLYVLAFIAEATVKTHLLRVFAKLDVSDRTHAVVVALDRGLLDRPGQDRRALE